MRWEGIRLLKQEAGDKPRKSVAPKVYPAIPKGSATSFQAICGYIFVIATFKFTYLVIKRIMFW
jgi:hypothetical protein